MSAALYNLAAMTVASTGTGTITLGSAATINGVLYLSFASAGVPNGATVYYSINDVGASEIGVGTYTSSGTTLTRSVINSTNSNAAINMTAAAIVRITPPTSQFRDRLTADRTYFVRTDGSNSNTGLANTAAGAWLTLQFAASFVMASLDLNGFNVTINIADGTYTASGGIALGPYVSRAAQGHTGPVIFVGNTVTPSNVVLDASGGAHTITCSESGGLEWIFKGVKIQNTTSANGVVADASGWVVLDNVVFGACASGLHAQAENGGIVEFTSNYTIAGNAVAHLYSITRGMILYTGGQTVTVNNGLAFSSFFAGVDSNAIISAVGVTYSLAGGAPTATRYNQQNGGNFVLNSDGSYKDPNTVFPGTANGFAYGSTSFEATAVVGDIPYAGATTPYWSRLASVALGNILLAGGVSTAPAWGNPAFTSPINLQLNASVSSNILTIAVKAANTTGDPSATAPVLFPFRDSTAANGDPLWRGVTAALSITTNATGATLGTANSVPFRLWVVAFDNSGTVVLALWQSVTGGATPTAIAALNPAAVASSTAISGSATAAATFYTPNGTTVTSKSFCILGYVDYASGLATAGTYASAPTTVQLFGPGIKKPGETMQTVAASTSTITNNSTNAYSTTNNSLAISPTSAPNLVKVRADGTARTDAGVAAVVTQLHRGATAVGNVIQAFGAGGATWAGSNLFVLDAPGTTSSTTYAVKIKNTDNATQVSYPKGDAATAATICADEIMV